MMTVQATHPCSKMKHAMGHAPRDDDDDSGQSAVLGETILLLPCFRVLFGGL